MIRVFISLLVFTLIGLEPCLAKELETDILKTRLSSAKLKETLEEARIKTLKQLPGGVFHAPKIHSTVKSILAKFQKSPKLSSDAVYEIFLASTPTINAWVSQVHEIKDVKVYHIVVTKGFIDLVSNLDRAIELLGDTDSTGTKVSNELIEKIMRTGKGILASILSHEFGHVLLGHNENEKQTTGVLMELDADSIGVDLLAEAGFAPESMVDLLKILDKLSQDRDLRQLVKVMLDVHPKANFRIANVQDKVNILSIPSSTMESMSLIDSPLATPVEEPLLRTAKERVSKTTVDAFNRRKSSHKLSEKPLNKQLHFLEQYLATASTVNEEMPMSRQTVVAIALEYGRLVNEIENEDELRQLIASLYRFESTVSELAISNAKEKNENAKAALKRVKAKLTQKQIQFLEKQYPEGLNLNNMEVWVQKIDESTVFGRLIKEIKKTQSLEQLESILGSHQASFLEYNRIFYKNDSNYKVQFYQDLALRVLALTKSMDATFQFLEKNLLIRKGHEIPYFEQMVGALLHYSLIAEDISFSGINKRMDKPSTATEKIFSSQLSHLQSKSLEQLMKKRGLVQDGSPTDSTFDYGIGKKYQSRASLASDHVQFLHRALSQEGVNLIFNDILKAHFTISETVDLLIDSGKESEFWARLKKRLPDDQVHQEIPANSRTLQRALLLERVCGDIPEVFIYRDVRQGQFSLLDVVELLSTRKPEASDDLDLLRTKVKKGLASKALIAGKNELSQQLLILQEMPNFPFQKDDKKLDMQSHDLEQLSQSSADRLQREYIRLTKSFSQVSNFTGYPEGEPEEVVVEPPKINSNRLTALDLDQREELFSTFLMSDIERVVRDFSDRLTKQMPVYESALTEIVKEGKVTESVKIDFLGDLNNFSKLMENHINNGTALDSEFFVLRRRLKLEYSILCQSSAKILTKLPKESETVLKYLLDTKQRQLSGEHKAVALINTFISADKRATVQYLENPEKGLPKGLPVVLAGSLSGLISKFNGIAALGDLSEASSISYYTVMASTVFHHQNTKASSIDFRLNLTEQEREILLPLGSGFKEFLKIERNRTKTSKIDGLLLDRVADDLWAYQFDRAVNANDPTEALVFTLSLIRQTALSTASQSEGVTRMHYVLLMRSLELVENKEQMDLYASLLALYLKGQNGKKLGATVLGELLNADMKSLMNVVAIKYREHYYDRLAIKLNNYGSWNGKSVRLKDRTNQVVEVLLARIYDSAENMKLGNSWLFKHQLLQPFLDPMIRNRAWFQRLMERIKTCSSSTYTNMICNRGNGVYSISPEEFMIKLRENTPWSEELDLAIEAYVRHGNVTRFIKTKSKKREVFLKLIKSIRSLKIRERTYAYILSQYGPVRTGIVQGVLLRGQLLKEYQRAKEVWTDPVLEDLKQSQSKIGAWKISEQAWEDHVGARASSLGIDKLEAYKRLEKLYESFKKIESPVGGEAESTFVEGSRHRDRFIEAHAQSSTQTFEQLQLLEGFKSYNTETPYHKISKAIFEVIDEYLAKLEPKEQAEVALYLSGSTNALRSDLDQKLRQKFYGTHARKAYLRKKGFYFSMSDLREIFKESHPEEKQLAFRALFVETISNDAEAESDMVNRLLFSDPDMPDYLEKVLRIYVGVLNSSERMTLLSWFLAHNHSQRTFLGPEVLSIILGKGGIASAKLAQLIASHGFKLGPEYQEVLEIFKSQAQKVDKINFFKRLGLILPEELYKQIKSLDIQLGTGSYKIVYLATLQDGRRVVIKMAREYVLQKTAREFEVIQVMLEQIMADPDLRLENLPGLQQEMERIIKDELKFKREAEMMRRHAEKASERPLLIKAFGNNAEVYVPQPLEGWQFDELLVEEYVKAKDWDAIPDSSFSGWSKPMLAKASINEVINQLASYLDQGVEATDLVVLDIDPHEGNQLGQARRFGRNRLINIDLGQTVEVAPDLVQGFMRIILALYQNKIDFAVESAEPYFQIDSNEQREILRIEFERQISLVRDPVEAFTLAMETVELEGITLKSEFLFFQKLFATLVGLNRKTGQKNYLMKQMIRIALLRGVAAPRKMLKELAVLRSASPCAKALIGKDNI